MSLFEACGAALPPGILDPSSTSLGHAFQTACDALEDFHSLSDAMREHLRIAVESFGAELDRRPILLEQANQQFAKALAAEDADQDMAIDLHRAAIELAEGVLNESGPHQAVYWRAVRRIAGSKISLAQMPGFDAKLLLHEARQIVVDFATSYGANTSALPPQFTRAIYNAACATGRLYGFGDEDRVQLVQQLRGLLDLLNRSANNRLHLKKLLMDKDMRLMVENGELDDYRG